MLLEGDLILLKAARMARFQPCVCDSAERFCTPFTHSAASTDTKKPFTGGCFFNTYQWFTVCRRSSSWHFPNSFWHNASCEKGVWVIGRWATAVAEEHVVCTPLQSSAAPAFNTRTGSKSGVETLMNGNWRCEDFLVNGDYYYYYFFFN